MDNFLNASHKTNLDATCKGIEQLLKEKTGKEYNIKEKHFKISLLDVIEYLGLNKETLVEFIKINDATEEEKINFLICLIQNKKNFEMFIDEIEHNKDVKTVFQKYVKISNEYYKKNCIKA